jgi:replicative DNA helicase
MFDEDPSPWTDTELHDPENAATFPSLDEICLAERDKVARRIPTGLSALDASMRGGLWTYDLNIIGGAPGGHKTSLVASLALGWARNGVPTVVGRQEVIVAICAADERRGGYLSRWGQMVGVSRDDLDDERPDVRRAAWEHVRVKLAAFSSRLILADPRETTNGTAERLATHLLSLPGHRKVLIVDSLQAAQAFAGENFDDRDRRLQIDSRLHVLQGYASRGLCVIALSELSRAGYSSREQGSKLAAFKESGGIEYNADQALVLTPDEDDGFAMEIHVAKTRRGSRDVFKVRRSHELTYNEATTPPASPTDKRREEWSADRSLVLRLVGESGAAGVSTEKVRELAMRRHAHVKALLEELEREGRVSRESPDRSSRRTSSCWRLTSQEAPGTRGGGADGG